MPRKDPDILAEKQKLFVKEYLIDLNAKQAAIRAGYSKRSAHALGYAMLKVPKIQAAITAAMGEREKRTEINADYVLSNLVELTDRCMQKVPVMVKKGKFFVQKTEEYEQPNGEITHEGVWKFDSLGAAKALRMLGEHLALFKTVHSNDPENPIPSGSNVIFYIPDNGRIKTENNQAASGLSRKVPK